jgi:hypothetical protein
MLAVVIADVAVDGEYQFVRRRVGTRPSDLRGLAEWLVAQEVEEAVMESTAQYWRPVWDALERSWQPVRQQREGAGPMSGRLHLAQAQSNRGPAGRKKDFPDAERLVKRLVAQELTLSFVPDAEQRLWRTVMRRKYQLTRNRVQGQNRLECLLEEAHIKLSCPAWSPTCSAPVPGACCKRSRTEKRVRLLWRRWRINACVPRPRRCVMRSAPAPT